MLKISPQSVFAQLVSEGENVCYSPLSLYIALGMVREGAEGELANQLDQLLPDLSALSYESVDLDAQPKDEYASPEPMVQYANSCWVNPDLPVNAEYTRVVREKFGADIDVFDIDNPTASADKINAWVEAKTAKRIKDLIDENMITPELALVLINALYFKGSWANEFDNYNTTEEPFYAADGEKTFKTMRQTDHFAYAHAEDAEMVKLSFSYGRYSMLFAMPAEGRDMKDFVSGFDPYAANLKGQEINLHLPKFTIRNNLNLKDALKALELNSIFSAGELEGMAPEAEISDIIQQTFIDVTETGVEAAAATAVMVCMSAMPGEYEPPIEVKFNRPFAYYLLDNTIDVPLFCGTMATGS